jgi:hypothetical protein
MNQLRSTPRRLSASSPEHFQLSRAFEATSKVIQDFVLSLRLAKWRLISTAPYNQELELRVVDGGRTTVLEFPCLRTNADAWINVDLGAEVKLEAVEWRIWRREKASQPHHARIKFGGRQAILRHVKSIQAPTARPVWGDAIQ